MGGHGGELGAQAPHAALTGGGRHSPSFMPPRMPQIQEEEGVQALRVGGVILLVSCQWSVGGLSVQLGEAGGSGDPQGATEALLGD